MDYRYLGSSGLQVSALSFGAWVTFGDQHGEEIAIETMKTAFEAGVNFFDNAEVYSHGKAESIMGAAVKKAWVGNAPTWSFQPRSSGAEKARMIGASRAKHVIEGANASLTRLQMDYVDLIFCHRPDMRTPIEETVRAMNFLIDQGKAFYWGTSEWDARQIMQAYLIARREHLIPPTMEQPQYNMVHRERVEKEYLPLYKEFGLGTTTWSPLASGILTGKYNDGIPEGSRASLQDYQWIRQRFETEEGRQRIEKVKLLMPLAAEVGCSMAQLAIAWCLKCPYVSTVITGASRASQVTENMAALEIAERLTPDVLEKIEAVLVNRPKEVFDFRTSN